MSKNNNDGMVRILGRDARQTGNLKLTKPRKCAQHTCQNYKIGQHKSKQDLPVEGMLSIVLSQFEAKADIFR